MEAIVAAAILAGTAAVVSLLTWRRVHKVDLNVTSLRVEVNSRLTELIEASGVAGQLQGRADARREAQENGREEP